MNLGIGSDHRGDALAAGLAEHLRLHGHDIQLMEIGDGSASDYPDRAYAVARAVGDGMIDRGILLCGSGIGMAIAANKVRGVRAAVVEDRTAAELSRRHNDANVLCLSADRTAPGEIRQLTDLWLDTVFEGGRHQRRVDKIMRIEQEGEAGEERKEVKTAPR